MSFYCFVHNQLLQGKTIPKLGSLDQIETGSGDGEGHYSGDCDDEDGCGGSGGDELRRKVSKSKSHPFRTLFGKTPRSVAKGQD